MDRRCDVGHRTCLCQSTPNAASKHFWLQFLGPLPKEAEIKHQLKSRLTNSLVQTLTVDTSCHSHGVVSTDLKHHRYFCSEKRKVQKSRSGNKPVKGGPLWPSVPPKVPLPMALNPRLGVADAAARTTLVLDLHSTLPGRPRSKCFHLRNNYRILPEGKHVYSAFLLYSLTQSQRT